MANRSSPQALPSEITLHPFPGREAEARGIARSVKALLLAGASPREILVSYRDPGRAPEIERAFQEVGVPIWIDAPLSFRENLVADLLDLLLALAADDFPRPRVMELLAHAACRGALGEPPPDAWQLLDRRSRATRLLGGFEAWKAFLTDPETSDPRWDPLRLLTLIRDTLPPPASGGAPLFGRVAELVDRLRIPESVLGLGGDLEPWFALQKTLLKVARVLGGLSFSLHEARELLRILSRDTLPFSEPLHLDRVIVVNAFDAVGLSRPHLFLAGVSEGEFPPRHGWDPIFSARERARVNEALGVSALVTREIRREEDEACFRSLTSVPRRALHISYVAAPDEGPRLPSYLIDEFLPKGKVIRRPSRRALLPEPADLYSPRDLLLWIGARRFVPPAEERARLESLLPPEAVRAPGRGQARELARAAGELADLGAVTDPRVLAELAAAGSERAPMAVTRLEEFGRCPFRFFAGTVLGLEPLEEPDADVTPLDAGRLAHKVLCRAYASLKESGIPFSRREEVRARVRETAQRLLDEHGERLAPLPALRRLFERRFLLLLDQFVEWDLTALEQDGRAPERFEVDLRKQALEVEGETFFISGRCDRIDFREGEPFVVDYKWGSAAKFPAHHLLQVPLYAHLLAGPRVAGGGYFSLTRPDQSSIRRAAAWKGRQRIPFEHAVADALRWAAVYLRAIRRGIFPPHPAAKRQLPAPDANPPLVELERQHSPCDYCRFPSLCRIQSASQTRIPEPIVP